MESRKLLRFLLYEDELRLRPFAVIVNEHRYNLCMPVARSLRCWKTFVFQLNNAMHFRLVRAANGHTVHGSCFLDANHGYRPDDSKYCFLTQKQRPAFESRSLIHQWHNKAAAKRDGPCPEQYEPTDNRFWYELGPRKLDASRL